MHKLLLFLAVCFLVSCSARYSTEIAPATPTGYVHLALEQNGHLYPIAWAKTDGETCRFPSVGRDAVYCPAYYANNRQTPAGDPFLLDNDGNMTILSPNNLKP